ncbi:MAG TPA: TonB-dependent receptor [Myxococcales bacterium]|nr:TonB-dependent receptor [Myxococcales bacterium]
MSLALLGAYPAAAQTTAAIAGQILDSATFGPVSGAAVTASGPDLQGEETALSDDGGEFQLLLPPGVYELNVRREGYQSFTQEGIAARLDRTARVRLLILADTVTAAPLSLFRPAPLVAVPGAQTGGTVTREQMELVPYGRDTRSFEQAAPSVPGVLTDPFGLALAGSQSLESRIFVDGVDVTEPAFNRQGARLLQNFVQEMAVDTAGYPARMGRASGGIVDVVTRSGGNQFHGSAFLDVTPLEAARSDRPGLATIRGRQSLRYDMDGGFELGGPLLRDRLWFHAGFAPQIASHDVDRILQAGGATLSTGAYTATQSEFQYTGKLTFRAAPEHTFALSIFGNPGTVSGVIAGPLGLDAALNGNESAFIGRGTTGSNNLSLRYRGKLLQGWLRVEAAIFWHRSGFSVSPASVGTASGEEIRATPSVIWAGPLNLLDRRLIDGTTPADQVSGSVAQACAPTAANPTPCPVTLYATGGLTPQDFTADRLGARLGAGHSAEGFGRHQLEYGLELSRESYDVSKTFPGGMQALALPGGQLAITGFGHPDPLDPSVPARDAEGNLLGSTAAIRTHQWALAAFAQDRWNFAENLWLDAGLRLERQRMFGSAGSRIDAAGGGTLEGLQVSGLMPRLGLSYDFAGGGRSRAYAFYGRFYESLPLELADRVLSAQGTVRFTADASRCAASTSFVSLDPRRCPVTSPYSFSGASSGVLLDPGLGSSYDDQVSAGVRYQILRDVIVGIDYTHRSLGRAVEDVSAAAQGGVPVLTNPGDAGTPGAAVQAAEGPVPVPSPSRTYDGVTLSVARRFADGYFLQASYTVSSFRGNYAGPFRAESLEADPHLTTEYARAASLLNRSGALPGDAPQVIKVDGAYAWDYSPRTTFTLGLAFRAIQGAPLNFLSRDPQAPSAGETESFILPRGSAGRLPWQTTLDLRFGVGYALSGSYSLAVTLDLLNLLNTQSATAVDQRYSLDPSGVSPQPPGTTLDSLRNGAGQPVTVNPSFLGALAYTDPLAARLGLRLAF